MRTTTATKSCVQLLPQPTSQEKPSAHRTPSVQLFQRQQLGFQGAIHGAAGVYLVADLSNVRSDGLCHPEPTVTAIIDAPAITATQKATT